MGKCPYLIDPANDAVVWQIFDDSLHFDMSGLAQHQHVEASLVELLCRFVNTGTSGQVVSIRCFFAASSHWRRWSLTP